MIKSNCHSFNAKISRIPKKCFLTCIWRCLTWICRSSIQVRVPWPHKKKTNNYHKKIKNCTFTKIVEKIDFFSSFGVANRGFPVILIYFKYGFDNTLFCIVWCPVLKGTSFSSGWFTNNRDLYQASNDTK